MTTNELTRHLDQVSQAAEGKPSPPGLLRRIRIAQRISDRTIRDLASPHYLTDTGVRRAPEAKLFWNLILEHFAIEDRVRSEELCRQAADESSQGIVGLIDDISLTIGDYQLMYRIVASALPRLAAPSDSYAATAVGMVLATAGDDRCADFFDTASVEQHPVDKAMNLVRLAAYCIKRKKAYPRSQAALERAVGILDDSERSIKPAERHGCLASVYNLASLLALHTDGPMESARSLEAALDHAREAVMYPDRRSENARYGIQIFCNLAQLHCLREEYEETHKAILDNGTVFLEHAPEYRTEVDSCLAYINYLDGHFTDATRHAREAIRSIARQASPLRLAATRKVLIGSLIRLERTHDAAAEQDKLIHDPLGLSELSHDCPGNFS
ncbi:hypothetical protein [Corynebacterium otitidis]|uniref:Tetratricopeptide repeat protein n=1 Tax=Corynebacterium otitidis ATCC 51513 TaxID=883169 RepID=K0YFT8_9CORY|nr:hypothetical protein [Corynebacterium otitidis]EJZ82432.1 hypothetical protein HMPREF9719_00657 [Corynebacterium otitidis ATCC 51513]